MRAQRLQSHARRWAASLFTEALPAAETFGSPRAWSFTLLGLDAYCDVIAPDLFAKRLRLPLADRLLSTLSAAETKDWVWFEDGLAYDNARLPQALIVTGISIRVPAYVDAGLRSLRWLMKLQTTPQAFSAHRYGELWRQRKPPKAFDQQPLEAAATISACLAASRADSVPNGRLTRRAPSHGFLASNDLSMPLVDLGTGSCRDGLHPTERTETAAANLSYPTFSASRKFASLLAEARAARNLASCRALRAQIC